MVFQAEDRTRAKRQQSEVAIQAALQGKWNEAVQINKQILESFPTDVDAYNRLGKAQTELGKYKDARDSYMKALEIDPLNTIAQKNLTRLADAGQVGAAARRRTEALAADVHRGDGQDRHHHADPSGHGHRRADDRRRPGEARERRSGTLVVRTMDGELLGEVEPRLAQRLVKLMDAGNEYVAAIQALDEDGVKVFIRETFQDASQTGKLSLPADGHRVVPPVRQGAPGPQRRRRRRLLRRGRRDRGLGARRR